MDELYIIDAVSFLFRSYYAISSMTNQKGQSTQALYGFIRSIQKVIKDFAPSHLVAVFDGANNKQARQAVYQDYKSHRKKMPDDLFSQLTLALNYCLYAGIPYLSEEGIEADDLIGAIAKWAEAQNIKVFICSSDKDLCQLITDKVFMINTHKNNLLIDKKKVKEMYGVHPHQIVDYLAIMGDTSDNIPGIPGFGPKTASFLLQEYGNLDTLLSQLPNMKNKKHAEKIQTYTKQVRLSQSLAQLIFNVPYPQEKDFYRIKSGDLKALKQLYQEMNFSSLLKEMGKSLPLENKEVHYHIIDTEQELIALLNHLEKHTEICLDTETTGLETSSAQLVGIGLGIHPQTAWYITLNGALGKERVIKLIKPFFAKNHLRFYGHNIKYDIHILLNHGITLSHISFDTMLASYILNPQNNRHNLDQLTLQEFDVVKIPIQELIGQGKKEGSLADVPIEKVANYCCMDVDYTCRLKENFSKAIEQASLSKVFYEIEIPLIFVLVRMERIGMYVDSDQLKHLSAELKDKIKTIEQEIFALAGIEFNIKSPKQLSEVLFDRLQIKIGQKKKSTRADVLESLQYKHPIAAKVLAFRALEKLRSTYTETLVSHIDPKTNRIHSNFNQSVTATGRLSCHNPNLQNIPIRSTEGTKIRRAFKPSDPNWCYLSADYSQIELRLLAHFSQDAHLIDAFKKDEDIHAATAAAVFDVPLSQVTKTMRLQAKTVNFGIIYGQQAYGLSQQLGIELKEAALFIEKYFNTYPGVKSFLTHCKESARKTGMACTMSGRRRFIPEINSTNAILRAQAERLAVNTPLQGSQADLIKMAMIRLDEKLQKEKSQARMLLQIHDELILELPTQQIKEIQKIVMDSMENIAKLSVPLRVNITIGKNWGEC